MFPWGWVTEKVAPDLYVRIQGDTMDTNTPEVILNDDTTTDLTVLSHEFANAESRECNSTTVTEVPPVIKLIQAYASLIEASRDIATRMSPGDAAVILAFAAQVDTIASLFMGGVERLQRQAQGESAKEA